MVNARRVRQRAAVWPGQYSSQYYPAVRPSSVYKWPPVAVTYVCMDVLRGLEPQYKRWWKYSWYRSFSLYSTATQNHWSWVLRWLRPLTPQFCVGYTNMLVSKNARIFVTPDAKPKICVSPNAKPQHKSVEYRLRWVPNANFSHWACYWHEK